jgi:hypothetical protein
MAITSQRPADITWYCPSLSSPAFEGWWKHRGRNRETNRVSAEFIPSSTKQSFSSTHGKLLKFTYNLTRPIIRSYVSTHSNPSRGRSPPQLTIPNTCPPPALTNHIIDFDAPWTHAENAVWRRAAASPIPSAERIHRAASNSVTNSTGKTGRDPSQRPHPYRPGCVPKPSPFCSHCLAKDLLRLWIPLVG